jgi:hypothetical protein
MGEKYTVVAFEIPPMDDPKCTNTRNFQIKELDEKKSQVAVGKKRNVLMASSCLII